MTANNTQPSETYVASADTLRAALAQVPADLSVHTDAGTLFVHRDANPLQPDAAPNLRDAVAYWDADTGLWCDPCTDEAVEFPKLQHPTDPLDLPNTKPHGETLVTTARTLKWLFAQVPDEHLVHMDLPATLFTVRPGDTTSVVAVLDDMAELWAHPTTGELLECYPGYAEPRTTISLSDIAQAVQGTPAIEHTVDGLQLGTVARQVLRSVVVRACTQLQAEAELMEQLGGDALTEAEAVRGQLLALQGVACKLTQP